MVEKIIKLGNIMPEFDEAGNMITTKPIKNYKNDSESEKEDKCAINCNGANEECEPCPIDSKLSESYHCQYCDKEWPSELSKRRHEDWCPKNPAGRTYYKKPETEPVKKPEKKDQPKIKISKEEDIIKELKEFDKTFGLTDKQIVKYIRSKMKG